MQSKYHEDIKPLREYIKEHHAKGHSKSAIKDVLVGAGWVEDIVEHELNLLFKTTKKKRYKTIITILLLIIAGIIILKVSKDMFWIFLIITLSIIISYAVIFARKEISLSKSEEKIIEQENKTSLDHLHQILNKKETMKISEIMKIFDVDKEIADEWTVILSDHGLATIHYPLFGEPELRCKR